MPGVMQFESSHRATTGASAFYVDKMLKPELLLMVGDVLLQGLLPENQILSSPKQPMKTDNKLV